MGTVKVTTDFSYKNYTDTELSVQGTNVTDKMTDNANFPNPTLPLQDVKDTITSYNASLVKAEKGSADDRIIKNSWRAKLESQMK